MKTFFTILFLILFSWQGHSAELLVTAGGLYSQLNIYGQDKVPTYRGSGWYGEGEYLMRFAQKNAVSLFATISTSNLENTANDDIQEKINLDFFGAGVKLYFNNNFFSLGYGKVKFKNEVTGTVQRTITATDNAIDLGIGHRFKISRYTGIFVGLNALNFTIDQQDDSSITQKYQVWQYRAYLGLNFIIPSGPGEK